MRLTLFNWPPLASHLACLIGGLAIGHLSQAEHHEEPLFREGSLLLVAHKNEFMKNQHQQTNMLGKKFFVAKRSTQSLCRIHEKPLIAISKGMPPIFEIPPQEWQSLSPYLLGLGKKSRTASAFNKEDSSLFHLSLMDEAHLKDSPLCPYLPEVTYE